MAPQMTVTLRSLSFRAVALLVLGGFSLGAAAQIHRCKDESGQLVISDRPCEANPSMQGARQGSADATGHRIAAPQMANVRLRESESEAAYAFIPERAVRSTRQSDSK